MKLAETYTIHLCLEKVNPDVLMIDGSLFESYSYTNRSTDTINLYKGSILDLHLSPLRFRGAKIPPNQFGASHPLATFQELSHTRPFQCGQQGETLGSGRVSRGKDSGRRNGDILFGICEMVLILQRQGKSGNNRICRKQRLP